MKSPSSLNSCCVDILLNRLSEFNWMINVKVIKPQFVKKRVISPGHIRAKFLREDVSIRCNMFNNERAEEVPFFCLNRDKRVILRDRKSIPKTQWRKKYPSIQECHLRSKFQSFCKHRNIQIKKPQRNIRSLTISEITLQIINKTKPEDVTTIERFLIDLVGQLKKSEDVMCFIFNYSKVASRYRDEIGKKWSPIKKDLNRLSEEMSKWSFKEDCSTQKDARYQSHQQKQRGDRDFFRRRSKDYSQRKEVVNWL